MKLQQLLSHTRKAVDEYQMIQEGDHIAVGISGGKDSLTLLYALHGLKRFYPNHFELSAITVDLGYEQCDFTPIKELCREMEIPYRIVKTDKKRASYYNYYTNKRWGDADSYELCLNSSKLGIEGTAKAIEEYVLFKEGISDKQI